jgi:hypothetical protein
MVPVPAWVTQHVKWITLVEDEDNYAGDYAPSCELYERGDQ